jgi:3-isopropylmalate dehydratase small subunit
LNGLDDIGLTMEREDDISKFESQRGIHGGVVTG